MPKSGRTRSCGNSSSRFWLVFLFVDLFIYLYIFLKNRLFFKLTTVLITPTNSVFGPPHLHLLLGYLGSCWCHFDWIEERHF